MSLWLKPDAVINYYTVQLLHYQSAALKGYIHDSSRAMLVTFRKNEYDYSFKNTALQFKINILMQNFNTDAHS